MSYFIVVWMALLLISSLLGIALLNVSQISCFERVGDRLIVSVWLGIIALSIALLATALILPLSPLVGAIVAGSLCLLSLLSKRTRTELIALKLKVSKERLLGFLTLAIAIAALTTHQVTWQDTGYYHYQVIQWLGKFGIVPGVALLFPNFGFTSSWFALAAPLNADFFDARVSAVTNGFALFIATLQGVICLAHCLKRKAHLSDWFMVAGSLMLLSILMGVNSLFIILVSPSPDIPIIFLMETIAWSMLVISRSRLASLTLPVGAIDPEIIPLFLSVGAVTVKLTALPVLCVSSLFLVVSKRLKARSIVVAGVVIALLIAPMLLSGLTTSGCPLYPASLFCLDLPWLPTQEAIKQAAIGTHGVTNWASAPPVGIPIWLWSLWKWFSSTVQKQLMALFILLSIVPALYLIKRVRLARCYELLWVMAIAASGITFIALQSPFFRFAVPYLLLLPALSMAVYVQTNVEATFKTRIDRVSAGLSFKHGHKVWSLACLALVLCILTTYTSRADASQLLLPPPIQRIPVVVKQVNGIVYLSPVRDVSCWATQLPCARDISPDVKLRHPAEGIAGGFIRVRN